MQNLQTITTKELRDNLSEILERVAIGREEFIVSKFGRKKAMVVPVKIIMDKKRTSGLEKSFGAWKDKRGIADSAKFAASLRKKMSTRYGKISG